MAKITCPNKQYSGISASITFVNGVGETDEPKLIEWFREHGYEVEGEVKQNDNPGAEFEGKSVDELKAYAEEHEIDIGNATSEKGIIKKILEAKKTVE